jgi:hypothetical protein
MRCASSLRTTTAGTGPAAVGSRDRAAERRDRRRLRLAGVSATPYVEPCKHLSGCCVSNEKWPAPNAGTHGDPDCQRCTRLNKSPT